MKPYMLFRLANRLYTRAFWLYKPLYGAYKKIRERDESAMLRRCIRPGNRVVDIGANIGYFTAILARMTGPSGHVAAIEPDTLNYAHLVKRVAGIPWVATYRAALSDHDGVIDLHRCDDLNVDHRAYLCGEARQTFQVPCFSLDSLMKDAKVDFIKMDIQGYEATALRGMEKTLARNPGCRILMELWPYGLKLAGSSAAQVITLLNKYGLHPFLLKKGKLIPYAEHLVRCAEKKYYTLLAAKTKP